MPTPTLPEHATADGDGPRVHTLECRLPLELDEWMRVQRSRTRRSMTRIVQEAVAAYRVEVEAGRIMPPRGVREGDETTKYNLQVKDDLYEWLRTTAFHARTSINALVVAALARAHTAQTEGAPDS